MLAFAAAAAAAAFANSFTQRFATTKGSRQGTVLPYMMLGCHKENEGTVEGIIAPYACNEDIRCTVINAMIHTHTHPHMIIPPNATPRGCKKTWCTRNILRCVSAVDERCY